MTKLIRGIWNFETLKLDIGQTQIFKGDLIPAMKAMESKIQNKNDM